MDEKLQEITDRLHEEHFKMAMRNIVTAVLSNDLGTMQKWQQYLLNTVPKEELEKKVLEFFK